MARATIEYLDLYKFPTSRRLFAGRLIAELADQLSLQQVGKHARELIAHDEQCWELEVAWRAQREQPSDRTIPELNRVNDRLVTVLHRILSTHVDGATDSPTEHERRAKALLAELFPAGLAAVLRMNRVGQVNTQKTLLGRLDSPTYADLVGALGLEQVVARLRENTSLFERSLKARTDRAVVSRAQLVQARERGVELLGELVLVILHQTLREPTQREHLMWPIESQQQEMGKKYRSRRARKQPANQDVELIFTFEEVDDTGDDEATQPGLFERQ